MADSFSLPEIHLTFPLAHRCIHSSFCISRLKCLCAVKCMHRSTPNAPRTYPLSDVRFSLHDHKASPVVSSRHTPATLSYLSQRSFPAPFHISTPEVTSEQGQVPYMYVPMRYLARSSRSTYEKIAWEDDASGGRMYHESEICTGSNCARKGCKDEASFCRVGHSLLRRLRLAKKRSKGEQDNFSHECKSGKCSSGCARLRTAG